MRMKRMKCPRCNSEITETMSFCVGCGMPVALMEEKTSLVDNPLPTNHQQQQNPPSPQPFSMYTPVNQSPPADPAQLADVPASGNKPSRGNSKKLIIALIALIAVLLILGIIISTIALSSVNAEKALNDAKEAYLPPAEVYDIDTSANDPSNEHIRFTYDDRSRIISCHYEIDGKAYQQDYIYYDDNEKVVITTYYEDTSVSTVTIPYEEIRKASEDKPTITEVNGYYVKPSFLIEDGDAAGTKKTYGKAEDYVKTEIEYDLIVGAHRFKLSKDKLESGDTKKARLPQLTIDSPNAELINRAIHDRYSKTFESYKSITPDSMYDATYDIVDYAAYLNNNILSLIIETSAGNNYYCSYSIYNVDVTDGKQLTGKKIISYSDSTEDEVKQSIRSLIEKEFEKEPNISGNQLELWQSVKERSLSDSNINSTEYFFNENGHLAAVYHSYWIAGSGEHNNIAELDAKISDNGKRDPTVAETTDAPKDAVSEELFSQMPEKFVFASGTSAWSTTLTVHNDGSFEGRFSDSEMGLKGDDYPKGTIFVSEFSGKFEDVKKINDYTYSMNMTELTYEHEIGTETITNGIKTVYKEAYGLAKAKTIYVYTPDTPKDKLSEQLLSWLHIPVSDSKELGFYALYNTNEKYGFRGYDENQY